jgi:hypothetical protein
MLRRRSLFVLLVVTALIICQPQFSLAQQLDCNNYDLPVQFPFLTEGSGWSQEGYYATIQTADIDGNGNAELIARASDGIHEWNFSSSGAWVEIQNSQQILSDALGWNFPYYYSTIQFAVLNPVLKQADLIARAGDGIHVYRWDSHNKLWNDLNGDATGRPFPNSGDAGTDWTQPQYYTTIHVGTFANTLYLIGRGAGGLEWFSWNESEKTWNRANGPADFSDALGWGHVQYYSTLQVANLNGDPANEQVLARGISGVTMLYHDDQGWQSSLIPLFSDENGYGKDAQFYIPIQTFTDPGAAHQSYILDLEDPGNYGISVYPYLPAEKTFGSPSVIPLSGDWSSESQYLTIQTADVDGDGQMEILARYIDGLHIYHRNGSSWTEMTTAFVPQFSNANGFSLRSEYDTIQTASEGGTAILLGRGPYGMSTLKYTGQTPSAWGYASNAGTFPVVAGNPAHIQNAYAFISAVLSPGQLCAQSTPATCDIRSQYSNPNFSAPDAYSTLEQCTPTSCGVGIGTGNYTTEKGYGLATNQEFENVVKQLETETYTISPVRTYFQDSQGSLYQGVLSDSLTEDWVAGQLSLSESSNSLSAFNDLGLGIKIAGAIGSLVGVPGAGAMGNLISSIMSAGAAASTANGGTEALTVANIKGNLASFLTNTNNASSCFEDEVMSSWGLLEPMYAQESTLASFAKNQEAVDTTEKAFDLYTYQSLAPVQWEVYTPSFNVYTGCDPVPDGYPSEYTYPYHSSNGCVGAWFKFQNFFYGPPTNAVMDNLFQTGPCETSSGSCPTQNQLGVPPDDLFFGRNGWNLPGTLPEPSLVSGTEPLEKQRQAVIKAIDALSSNITSTVDDPTAQQSLMGPLKLAIQYLQPSLKGTDKSIAARSKSVLTSTQVQLADQMLQIFVMREHRNVGVTLTAAVSNQQTSSAYDVRSMLEVLASSTTQSGTGELLGHKNGN